MEKERQMTEVQGGIGKKKEMLWQKGRRGRSANAFQVETIPSPSTHPCLFSSFSPEPDWTFLVELIRYSQSPLSDTHLSSTLSHGWSERLRSFVDHYPCHILLQHCLPLQLRVVGINWEGGKRDSFDPWFPPLHPPDPPPCVILIFLW